MGTSKKKMRIVVFILGLLIALPNISKAQEKTPSTSVSILEKNTGHTYQYLANQILKTELNTPVLVELLLSAQYDNFIKKGKELLKSDAIESHERQIILNTIILLYSLKYDYEQIYLLRKDFNLDEYDLSVNWEEIDFFKEYTTEIIFSQSFPIEIPFKWSIAKTPVIDVEIDGQKFSFWLDVGASGSVISSSVASKIGVIRSNINFSDSSGSTDNNFVIKPAIVPKLSIEEITMNNLPVAILSSEDLTLAPGITIDGIIGLPFLFEFTSTFNNQESLLILEQNEERTQVSPNFFWLGYPIVELRLLSGTKTYWGFDTGAGTSRMKNILLDKLDSTYQVKSLEIQESGVGGLTSKFESFMLDEFSIFCGEVPIIFNYIKSTTPEGVRTELLNADGKLGSDVIYNSKGVRFSFKNGYFKFIE